MLKKEEVEKEKAEIERIKENYRKAERRCNIAAVIWCLCILVQILANLDKIFPFIA